MAYGKSPASWLSLIDFSYQENGQGGFKQNKTRRYELASLATVTDSYETIIKGHN